MTEQAEGGKPKSKNKGLNREERRAAALRANLAKRKAKARGLADMEKSEAASAALEARPDLD